MPLEKLYTCLILFTIIIMIGINCVTLKLDYAEYLSFVFADLVNPSQLEHLIGHKGQVSV